MNDVLGYIEKYKINLDYYDSLWNACIDNLDEIGEGATVEQAVYAVVMAKMEQEKAQLLLEKYFYSPPYGIYVYPTTSNTPPMSVVVTCSPGLQFSCYQSTL